MKIAKIIIGIVCILLSFVIAYQSAVAGVAGIMTSISSTLESAFGGSNVPQEMDMSFFGGFFGGFFVAVSYYASGITSIAACGKRGGSVACFILMFVACLVGIGSLAFGPGVFTGLIIWSLGAFAMGVFYIVDATKDLKKK